MSPKATTSDLESEAAEILRSVNDRAAVLNQTALDAAREGEAARQNARKAAALARRYATQKSLPHRGIHTTNDATHTTTQSSSSSSSSPPRLNTQAKLLNLSLELERCQRALAEEKAEHKLTQQALTEAQTTATKRQTELEALLHDQETMREEFGRKNDELQRELNVAKQRLEAADQDAALALELAQHNAQAREEIEAWYQQCLDQNAALEQQCLQLQNGEHGANRIALTAANDENTATNETALTERKASPIKSLGDDSMAAAGREVLKSFRNKGGRQKVASPSKAVERMHERRQHFAERLKAIDEPLKLAANPRSETSINSRISKILQESGRRLSLPGRWWKKSSASTESADSSAISTEDTESLAQHYCHAVEVSDYWKDWVFLRFSATNYDLLQHLVERKDKDLFELQTFCDLMENGGDGTKQ